MRDRMLDNWKYSEACDTSHNFGSGKCQVNVVRRNNLTVCYNPLTLQPFFVPFSCPLGYPSDPKCKKWMEENPDPVFGYPDIMRFSWAPSKQQMEKSGVPVVFRADLDDEEEFEQKQGLSQFLQKKRKRLGYFEKRNIGVKKCLLE